MPHSSRLGRGALRFSPRQLVEAELELRIAGPFAAHVAAAAEEDGDDRNHDRGNERVTGKLSQPVGVFEATACRRRRPAATRDGQQTI